MGLWTVQHAVTLIPAIGVMVILGVLARKFLAGKEESIRLLPLKVIAILLLVLEVGKQIVSAQGGYNLYSLPFHYCSIYLFAVPVMAFYGGEHKKTVREITFALTGALFLIMLIYPSLIYSADNIRQYFSDYMSFHTVTFHNLVMLVLVLEISLNIPEATTKWAIKPLTVFLLIFCAISASMAQLLKTNYANFYSCNVPPLEAVRVSMQAVLGYGLTQFLYVLAVTAVTILFTFLFYGICRLARRLVAEKTASHV